jgi:membrane protein required for colicin V production
MGITVIDGVVVAVVLISAVLAMWRGLIQETFSIFEWVGGTYIALRFAPTFQPLVGGIVSPPWLAWIAVFVGTFLIVFIPLSILSHRLSELVKASEIGPVDRVLGLVFGAGRGLIIVGLGYIAFALLVPLKDHPLVLTQARLFPLIQNTSEVLLALVPGTKAGLEPDDDSKGENPLAAKSGEQNGKTYGARERGALDRLIEATGRNQDSSR